MRRALLFLAFIAALPMGNSGAVAGAQEVTLIQGARVFDGERLLGVRDVLVSNGTIASVSGKITPPAGALIIDGRGKTLLPGLIDSHTHAFGDALEQALVYGVTTELDMFTDAAHARVLRTEQSKGNVPSRADIFSAGILVTAPKGHGTEYGMAIPTISSPDSAQAFVDARIAEGSDYIKIVYDDGRSYGTRIATVSPETLRAVIKAAHNRKKLAVVHVGAASFARDAIEAGADGLVHLFSDAAPDAGFGKLVASKKAFVIPTLTVLASLGGKSGAGDLVNDKHLSPFLSTSGRGTIGTAFPFARTAPPRDITHAFTTVRQLAAAGVPVLAGTDAPNPGTAHGIAMHRELELLTKAGLGNAQALVAATSAPAKAFGLGDRGRIARGLRADLLLVDGDPLSDITATRLIAGVWKGGVKFDRQGIATSIANASKAASGAGATMRGLISGFDDSTTRASFGNGWMISTDKMAGGSSEGAINVVNGGANGTTRSLAVTGTVVGPLPYAWSGVMFMPGAQPMAPVDITAAKSIEFWAKGDGRTYKVMLFSQSKGMTPLMQDFVAGPEWKRYEFPFSSFDGVSGMGILSFGFTSDPTPGKFSFQVDEVALR